MKTKFFMLLAAITMTATVASAQDYKNDPKYGADPASREENVKILNMFQDAYKMKSFDEATVYMRQLIERAPKCSQNLYINGAEIYRNKLVKATSKEARTKCLDSIMIIFDLRCQNFGEHPTRGMAYIKAQKALIFNTYAADNKEKLFELFRDAIQAGVHDLDPKLAVVFFNSLTESYRLDDITPELYIVEYEKLQELLAINPSDGNTEASGAIEALFVQSGAASCENIEKIYKPKYEATPDDEELIKKILGLFQRSKCSSEFQMALIEKYYQIDPKPELALMLAGAYEAKGNYTKALEYIEVAIQNEKDPTVKANYLVRAAGATLAMNNYVEAAKLSRRVLEIDPNNGFAYLFYAGALAGGVSTACSDFDRQAAYWIVVDNYQEARKHFQNDPAQLENINKMIGSFAANFPKSEELFMRGLETGAGYTVNCGWISGRTTVRSR